MADRVVRGRDLWPLGALGFILAVTASWWALALWPGDGAPEWLERTRSVCFNITESGLPDAKGWLLLLGQPPSMLGLLLIGWRQEVRASLAHLGSSTGGRALLVATAILVTGGLAAAGRQIVAARLPEVVLPDGPVGGELVRIDRPWPEAEGLVDQDGRAFTRATLSSRAALVTFAFGHCETVCPAVIHEARSARLTFSEPVSIVVLTLDPWRDTPGRLHALLEQFQLDPATDHVVGGSVAAVESALDAWDIQRQRDTRTGDIVHPSLVYLVDTYGTVAHASRGSRPELVRLAEHLGWSEMTR